MGTNGIRHALSSAPIDSSAPPSEFRLLARGVVKTSKGDFTLDEEAARRVLAAAKEQGHRYVLDLEHSSLEPGGRTDALAYFSVALKADGLYAVDVRWTPEGIERLASKKQIFVSPAFMADEHGRIVELINAALTSMPATYNSTELVAASRRGPLTRSGSTTVRARVVKADAEKFRALAKGLGQTPGETLRVLVALAVKDPTKTFAAVAELLELPPDALPTEVLGALEQLVADVTAEGAIVSPSPGGDALTDTAAPPLEKLSKEQAAACVRRGHPATEAGWTALKKSIVGPTLRSILRKPGDAPAATPAPPPVARTNHEITGLSDAERAFMAKHKMSRDEYLARKAKAVRRASPSK